MRDQEIRAVLDQHWAASDSNDFETEHRIYHEDAVLEYPQSGEQPAVDATYRINALVSRAKSGLLSDESLAAVIFGSPNSS
jgi:ketosteroid isomerase-like protein